MTIRPEILYTKEFRVIYRGPGHLGGRMIRLLAHPPSPHTPVRNLYLFLSLSVYRRRSKFLTREWGRVGEEPNHKTAARKHGPL
jgi:hypothetical protein